MTGRTSQSPVWGFRQLWANGSKAKCKLAIPDTIFFQDCKPVRWCFTSRKGEVVRKRDLSPQTIIEKFALVSMKQPTAFVVRFEDGRREMRSQETLVSVLQGKEVLQGLCAVQLVDKAVADLGHYRTEYKLISASGKAAFRTFRQTIGSDGSVQDVECKASGILLRLKQSTQGIINFVEAASGVKVALAALEFYVTDVIVFEFFLSIDTIEDIASSGLSCEKGRLDGFGFPKVDNTLALGGPSRTVSAAIKEPEDINVTQRQLNFAVQNLEKRSSQGKTTYDLRRDPSADLSIKNFPTPFRCHGDFCDTQVTQPLNLNGASDGAAVNVAKHVLTATELNELGNKVDSDLPLLLDEHKDGDFGVTHNSIILARKERRQFVNPRRRDQLAEDGVHEAPRYSKPKRCQAIAIEQDEGQLQLQLGNYYELVRVCLPCYRVYKTLDKARQILQSKRLASRAQKVDARTTTEVTAVHTSRDYLAKHGKLPEKAANKEKCSDKKAEEGLKRKEIDKEVYYKLPSIYKVKPTRAMAMELKQSSEIKDFKDLDSYLRGVRESKKTGLNRLQKASRLKYKEKKEKKAEVELNTAPREVHDKRGRVLVVECDREDREVLKEILEGKDYVVTALSNGEKALETLRSQRFELMLISRELPHLSGIEVVKLLRKQERSSSHRMATIVLSQDTEPEDLRLFMEAGMDGCVSKPIDEGPLLQTVASAIPQHQPLPQTTLRSQASAAVTSSSTIALRTLPPPQTRDEAGTVSRGTYRLSSDITIPYVVLGQRVKGSRVFNFVVVHDIFDTMECMELFFRPLVSKYVGLQVLLFNYSGQAFTEWREDTILNNAYHAECMEKLLHHVDSGGTREFHNSGPYASPYYILGFGNGANIALCHALAYKPRLLRSCLLLNGFTHVDPNLAAILHDCVSVFSCSPSTRPDLPVYFYTRFIFSPKYLTKVSTPLALNMYTAVHNPITLEGRIQLCRGALAHVDLREELSKQGGSLSLLLGQSAQGMLVKPYHVDVFLKTMGGEASTIRESLVTRKKPCVIWFQAGHELFQECRRSLSDLVEQLGSGYHEKYSAKFVPSPSNGPLNVPRAKQRKLRPGETLLDLKANAGSFEDRFINNVLKSLNNGNPANKEEEGEEVVSSEVRQWKNFQEEQLAAVQHAGEQRRMNTKPKPLGQSPRPSVMQPNTKVKAKSLDAAKVVLDPESRYFDARDNRVLKRTQEKKLEVLQNAEEIPEVREYMQWRVSRNRKRLRELEANSRTIQRSWRAFLARTMYARMKRESSRVTDRDCLESLYRPVYASTHEA